MRRSLLALACLSVLAVAACETPPPVAPAAPPPKPVPVSLDSVTEPPLAIDGRIRKGKLENGLTYYVLPHKKPENRAQVWLAVNTGSVMEDDDQRGLAHFCEHMLFNGTKRFPKAAIIDFVEKSGVRFGADLNAYTNFDETVYTLQVPTDKPEILSKSISVLRDWAGDASFEPAEVDKERGVVLEEWRLKRGVGRRISDKQMPVLLQGSKYAERQTIGKPETLKTAPRDVLYRFYKDWYRPDLMAVIAVGDFKADEMEKQIKAEFGNLPAPAANARKREDITVPARDKELVSIETDPEATGTSLQIVNEVPKPSRRSESDFRRTIGDSLFSRMFNARLDEIRRMPNAPFLGAGSGHGRFARGMYSFNLSAQVKEDGVHQGYSALLEELLRVDRHGFTATELERAKQEVLRGFKTAVIERETRDAKVYAQEMVRNFLQDEFLPGPEFELGLAEKMLPTFKLEELNAIAKNFAKGSRVTTVVGTPKMAKVTAESLTAAGKEVASKDIKPYEDVGAGAALMAKAPAPGPVVKTKTIAEIGVTEWTLKNGVKVVIKPTTFTNDQIRIAAFSPGGYSLVKDTDLETAKHADTIIGSAGVGALDGVALRKATSGKMVSLSPRIGDLEEGLSGLAAPADLETLMQMIHLMFTQPRRDEGAFATWKSTVSERVKTRRATPEAAFAEDMLVFSTQNHPRRQPTTPEALEKVTLDKALAIYKDRFGDAGDFTFLLVGNVDVDKTKTLVETYLGSLPAKGRKETWKDSKVTKPSGVAKKVVTKGTEPKSTVSLTFHGPEKWSKDAESDMKLLVEVLRMRLREVIREDMGGTYGVQVSGAIVRRPKPEYAFTVGFSCAPENVERLEKAVFDEVKSVQENGIADSYLAKIKEIWRRSHETELKKNEFWLAGLERAYVFGDDPKQLLDNTALLERATSEHVKAAAKKYVNPKQYILGELRPENAGAAAAPGAPAPPADKPAEKAAPAKTSGGAKGKRAVSR